MAARTLGWRWPTLLTPMPPAKSTYSRPSTSVSSAPSALAMNRGLRLATPRGMCRLRRSANCSVCLAMRISLGSKPEIGFLHLGITNQVSTGAGHDDAAVFQDEGNVSHLQRLVNVLLHQEDRQAAPVQLLDDPEDLLDQRRGQAQTRLVEDQDAGLLHQGPADGQHLLLAPAQGLRHLSAAFRPAGEDVVGPFQVGSTLRLGPLQVGTDGQV